MPSEPTYDVFLSHGSADKPEVRVLARKLRDEGVKVFLDEWYLVPGRDWLPALDDALARSRTCVVFVGARAPGPWASQEMYVALDRAARDPEFAVIPVLLPGAAVPNPLPPFLFQKTWVKFSQGLEDADAFHRLLCGIRGVPPEADEIREVSGENRPARPYRSMAPPPEAFVHRSEYDRVVAALCPPEEGARGATMGTTTALRGAGGFGKTALAQAICRDPGVHERYPDGVLWATMGEDVDPPGRLSRVRELIRWWTDQEPLAYETATAAGAKLRELLNGHRVLLVVDDVWRPEDVTPFQGLAAGSALLVTTRDSRTLPVDRTAIEVDAMTSSEAVALLGAGLPGESSAKLAALAARLGEWPLLLTIVNGQLRKLVTEDGLPSAEALREVGEALDAEGLTAFDREDVESRNRAVARTLSASLQRLSETERRRYEELAVFPEDRDVPLSVLERLWQVGAYEAKKLCGRLHDLSLLLRFDRQAGTIRLHDIVRTYLLTKTQSERPAVHRRLLNAYRPASGRWPDLPREERYLWRNLPHHLVGGGERETFLALLFDFDYLQTKLEATDVNDLLADYAPSAEENGELRLIQGALRLSAHVLAKDRKQLAPQLLGRLMDRGEPGIQLLIQKAKNWRGAIWFRPLVPGFIPPGGSLIRTLEGHTGQIRAIAVLDDRRVISGSADKTLRLWELESGETLRVFEGHTLGVTAVSVLDGRRVVSGSDDGTVRLWDLGSGETLRILEGHTQGVQALSVLDGSRVVSGSFFGTLRLWEVESGEILRTLESNTVLAKLAVFDRRRVVWGSGDGMLRSWDVESGEALHALESDIGLTWELSELNGRRVVWGSSEGRLRLWDMESGGILRTLERPSGSMTSHFLALSAVDGGRVVSGSDDGRLRLWGLESGKPLRTLEGHTDRLVALSVLDGDRVVSGSDDGTIRLWDLESREALRTLEGHTRKVTALSVLDDNRVVSGSDDGTVRLWDVKSGETLRTLESHTGGIRAMSVLDERRIVLSGRHDDALRVWDLESGEVLRTLEVPATGFLLALWILDGGRVVLESNGEKGVCLWDLESGKILRTLDAHSIVALSVVDGGRVILGSRYGEIHLWDLESGRILRTLAGHTDRVSALSALDGGRVVSSSSDGTVRLWDLKSGETLRTFECHPLGVTGLSALDDRRAVACTADGTLRLWSLETGQTLAVLNLEAPATALALSPTTGALVVGDKAGRMHFLTIQSPGS